MVTMKCEMCGATWTKDDSYKGMEIKCSNCQGRCKCLSNDETESLQFECVDCGLACSAGAERCPACGGKVIAGQGTPRQEVQFPASGQDFLKSWEENLGGHAFSVIISLTACVVAPIFFLRAILWESINSRAFLCFARIDAIMYSLLSIYSVGLLCLFFKRSRQLYTLLPSYFKIRGFVTIIEFAGLILLGEIGDINLMEHIDIKPIVMGIFWCFFWAWYFKRAFHLHSKNPLGKSKR